MLQGPDQGCDVSVHRDLESVQEAWRTRSSARSSGVLHVSFVRPHEEDFAATLSRYPGRLLISSAAAGALPDDLVVSLRPVAEPGAKTLYLAPAGWGADGIDPDGPLSGADSEVGDSHCETGRVTGMQVPHSQDATPSAQMEALFLQGVALADTRPEDVINALRFAPEWLLALPTHTLDLSARPKRVLREQKISTIGDLASYSASEVLRFHTLGQKSFNEIASRVAATYERGAGGDLEGIEKAGADGPVRRGGSQAFRSFGQALTKALADLPERDMQIMGLRMGITVEPMTLEAVAKHFGLTREGIRQVEIRCMRRFISARWIAEIPARLAQILDGRRDPLPFVALDILDPWFEGAVGRLTTFEYILDRETSAQFGKFYVLRLGPQEFVSRLSQERWDDCVRVGRSLLAGLVGRRVPREDAKCLVEGLLTGDGEELRSELWDAVSASARFVAEGGVERLLSVGRGAEPVVEAILAAAEEPLHYIEIHRRALAAGESLDVRNVRNAASSVGLLFGRGIYGVARHLAMSKATRRQIVLEVEDIISSSPADRQWHAAELCRGLADRSADLGCAVDQYTLSIVLRESGALSYLGRHVWVAGQVPVARVDLGQAIHSILVESGHPLSTDEIRDRLSVERGISDYFQIHPEGDVVRLGAARWGLVSRDVPFSASDVGKITAALWRSLATRGRGIHVTEIAEALADSLPPTAPGFDPEIFLGLARKVSGLSVSPSGYVYLTEWGEPRRLSVSEAIATALREAGPNGLPADEAASRAETLLGRSILKARGGLPFRGAGASFDEVRQVWKLDDVESQDSEDD
ncbi:MAG: hypothetical protein K1X67_26070 [Fimbriimonadaceae bacterium]|nr:hypothetical protein [Fimbriimonadaceae bacterium]